MFKSILLPLALIVVGLTLWLFPEGPQPTKAPPKTAPVPTPGDPEIVFPPVDKPAPIVAVDPDYSQWSEEEEEIRQRLLAILRQPLDVSDPHKYKKQRLAQRNALLDFLDTLGESEVELLVALLLQEEDALMRRYLLMAIGRIGSPLAVDALTDHYWRVFRSNQETELNYTIKALGLAKSPASFDRLSEMIQTDLAAEHRFRFIQELGDHPDSRRAIPLFLESADRRNDDYFKNRSRAALALKIANDPRSAPKVEQLLDHEDNEYVRQALCGTLGALGDPASVARLKSIAEGQNEQFQTRMSAVRALTKIGTEEARVVVEGVANNDGDERVRKEAVRRLQDF